MPATSSASPVTRLSRFASELPLDIVSFYCLTPLPGSEDHKLLWQKGVPMDTDGWLQWTYRQVRAEHRRRPYTDQALTPVTDDETSTLDLFTHNDAARAAVAQRKKVAELTSAAAAARPAVNAFGS